MSGLRSLRRGIKGVLNIKEELMPKGSQEIIDALNKDIADELAAIVQYMWHHVMGAGISSPAIVDEMKHAEALAERVDYLGGVPTKQPSPIKMGGELRNMIQEDLDNENAAI